jgi:hypothetical protein
MPRTRWDTVTDELWDARHALEQLLPSRVQDAFRDGWSLTTSAQWWDWQRTVIARLVALAEPIPESVDAWDGPRAWCPLCTGGSSHPYAQGFKLDEGLERHLAGWGNTHQCSVLYHLVEQHRPRTHPMQLP